MSHPQLVDFIEKRLANGQDQYAPLIVKVARKGNPDYGNTYAFEGIDGFWNRKDDKAQPEVGAIHRVRLATKAKTGSNARAGSEYMDILEMWEPMPPDTELTPVGPSQREGSAAPVAESVAKMSNYLAAFDPSYMLQNIAKSTADIAIAAAMVASVDAALADPDALDAAKGAIAIAQEETDAVKAYLMQNWQPTNAEPPALMAAPIGAAPITSAGDEGFPPLDAADAATEGWAEEPPMEERAPTYEGEELPWADTPPA